MLYKSLFIISLIVLCSCSNRENKIHKSKNIKIEKITRSEKDNFQSFENVQMQKLEPYYFEEGVGNISKITKEYFRCKGNSLNLERIDDSDPDNVKVFLDCDGASKHSLPLINKKEGVYPVLVDLLNYIQRKTKRRVIITCGHRCPKHNTYADFYKTSKTSKHMIGAEVDFYVEGYEQSPFQIQELVFKFYKEKQKYRNLKEFEEFFEYTKDTDVKQPPFYNKEIFVKVYEFDEGRDFSNRHPYPYISIQVLWDRDTKQRVLYTWDQANRKILRF